MNEEFFFEGKHILGELYGIDKNILNNLSLLEEAVRLGIRESNTTSHGTLVKKFEPAGLTLISLLSESHVSIHTYPEYNSLFLDAFTCGNHCNPKKIIDKIIDATNPSKVILNEIIRGKKEYIERGNNL